MWLELSRYLDQLIASRRGQLDVCLYEERTAIERMDIAGIKMKEEPVPKESGHGSFQVGRLFVTSFVSF